MRLFFPLLMFTGSLLAIGCGGSASTDPLAETQTPATSAGTSQAEATDAQETPQFAAQRPAKTYDKPGEAVTDFLVAVKAGQHETATALLTTAAQEEAWTNGLAISSDGFAEANFQVSEVEFLKENTEAHVMSVWSDVTPEGNRKDFQCVWLLRKEAHGWCIYGMATKFLDSAPPVVLNFENQNEMQRRQRWAEQQIADHRKTQTPTEATREPIQQATRPGTTTLK